MDNTDTSLNLSVETTPKKISIDNISDVVLTHADYITITHLPSNPLKLSYKSASRLVDKRSVDPSRIVPHIAARSITSKVELTRQLKNFEAVGIRNLIIVGGNPTNPRGPYPTDDSVRARARDFTFRNLYCGVYPDTQSVTEVQMHKYSQYSGGVSQICLSPSKLEGFKPSTRIGVPSKATREGLLRYMKICGVGPSLRFPLRNAVGLLRFTNSEGFDTSKFVRSVQPHHEFHVFDFGRIEETVEELVSLDV